MVKLQSGDLKVGDEIKLVNPDGSEFTQKVESLQIEHAEIEIAKKGDEFGLKVKKPVKPRTQIYKVS